MFLGLNNDLAIAGQIPLRFPLKPVPGCLRQRTGNGSPPQRSFAVDFIDVLSTGPAAARKRPLQLLLSNYQSFIDLDTSHLKVLSAFLFLLADPSSFPQVRRG